MATSQLRPTFNRLPIAGYQDNPLADALTQFYDEKLVAVGTQVQNFHALLDPLTCPVGYLDYLAYLVGMVYPYYDTTWSAGVKQQMILNANKLFWSRGTKDCLRLALEIQGVPYGFYNSTNLILSFTFTSDTKFGLDSQLVFVTIPTPGLYPRNSREWLEATRAIQNYTAIAAPVQLAYDHFYLGYSTFGDPFL